MKKFLLLIAFASLSYVAAAAKSPVTLFLVGDETMADNPNLSNDACGWGQCFPTFVQGIHVENHAVDSASSRTYIQDGHWDAVLARAKRNDVVFIQLGLHDIYPEDSLRYSSVDEFATNLSQMIAGAKKKNLCVVLFTPNSPCFFKNSVFYHRLGAYPEVIRRVAAVNELLLVDLEQLTAQKWEELGEAQARSLFLAGSDLLLLTEGALVVGKMASDVLRELNIKRLVKYLNESQEPIFTQPWQPVTEEVEP